jgi:hypothetical protein
MCNTPMAEAATATVFALQRGRNSDCYLRPSRQVNAHDRHMPAYNIHCRTYNIRQNNFGQPSRAALRLSRTECRLSHRSTWYASRHARMKSCATDGVCQYRFLYSLYTCLSAMPKHCSSAHCST